MFTESWDSIGDKRVVSVLLEGRLVFELKIEKMTGTISIGKIGDAAASLAQRGNFAVLRDAMRLLSIRLTHEDQSEVMLQFWESLSTIYPSAARNFFEVVNFVA